MTLIMVVLVVWGVLMATAVGKMKMTLIMAVLVVWGVMMVMMWHAMWRIWRFMAWVDRRWVWPGSVA